MPSIANLLELCKLKVVSLIMLTAVVGMLLAVPYLPNLLLIIVASAGIALSAMSAAVFNHVVDEKNRYSNVKNKSSSPASRQSE